MNFSIGEFTSVVEFHETINFEKSYLVRESTTLDKAVETVLSNLM